MDAGNIDTSNTTEVNNLNILYIILYSPSNYRIPGAYVKYIRHSSLLPLLLETGVSCWNFNKIPPVLILAQSSNMASYFA